MHFHAPCTLVKIYAKFHLFWTSNSDSLYAAMSCIMLCTGYSRTSSACIETNGSVELQNFKAFISDAQTEYASRGFCLKDQWACGKKKNLQSSCGQHVAASTSRVPTLVAYFWYHMRACSSLLFIWMLPGFFWSHKGVYLVLVRCGMCRHLVCTSVTNQHVNMQNARME